MFENIKPSLVKIVRFFRRAKNKSEIKKKIAEAKNLKVVVGAGGTVWDGWIATDQDVLDVTMLSDWQELFKKNTISNIVAEHVWEHLTAKEGITAIKNGYQFLKRGGRMRIAVPDGLFPDKTYRDYVRPQGVGPGARDHKILYTYKSLTAAFKKAGFTTIEAHEYHDSKGKFHYQEWSVDDGMISRSKRFDARNTKIKLGYTSLIIDGIK